VHPLIQGIANVAALDLVFYDHKAQETASGSQARAHGIGAGEHAVEGEGHVVVFGELEDGQHAFGFAGSSGGATELRSVGQPRTAVPTCLCRRALLGSTAEDGCPHRRVARAQVHDVFGQGEDAGLAGDYEEAMSGIATEPARPLQAAWIYGAVEAVPG